VLLNFFMYLRRLLNSLVMKGSNNFTELANSIQNGSHPSPPIDPVPSAMHDLQLELQDVIAGFETRFRRLRRNGSRAFNSLSGDAMDEEETEQVSESHQSPEFSILPIPEDDSSPATPISGSELPVVGRGKAEVEEAYTRAEVVMDREHPQDSTDDETNRAGLTQTDLPPSVSPLHAEL
jgi:hypothetical protein